MNLSDLSLHSPHCLQQHQQHDRQHHRCDKGDRAQNTNISQATPFQEQPVQKQSVQRQLHKHEKQRQQQSHPLQAMNVSQQQQLQQHHQDYRSNSRASDRFATTTPTSSTSSDNYSDSGEGIGGGRGSVYDSADTVAQNPDQMAKKRTRSMDGDTAVDFSQLFISPTLTTTTATPPPTTKTTLIATATTDANMTALNSRSYYINRRDLYYYSYPPEWTSAFVAGSGERGRGQGVQSRADGPRPSWPPSRRIKNFCNPPSIPVLHSPFVPMDPTPYPHQSAFPPDAQQQDNPTLYPRAVAQGLPGPGHHSHHSYNQHYPSPTPVAKDPSSLPPSSSPFHNSHRQPQQSFWPPRPHNQQQPYPAHPHYHQEHPQHRSHQWHRGQEQQGVPHPLTQQQRQHHDEARMEKDDSNSGNDKSKNNNNNDDNDYPPPPSSKRLSASSSSSAIDLDPQNRQQGLSAAPHASSASDPMDANSSTSMPVDGSGSGSWPPLSFRGTVLDRGGYVDDTMQEDDQRSYPPRLPPHSPRPHRLPHPHSIHYPSAYPYSPASPASFAHRERERDFDMTITSSSSTRRPSESTRPVSNLTYQHRQQQLQQQQQQQQYNQAALARHPSQGRSPPTSPSEGEAFGSRSTRFSPSSIDGNNHLNHTAPPLSHPPHRESSLPLSTKVTAAMPASIGNQDPDSAPPLSDRPSSLSTSHGRTSSQAAAASTPPSSITQAAATIGQSATTVSATTSTTTTTTTAAYNPPDDYHPSSSSRPYARRDWDYDLVPRASFHPLDNPRDFNPYIRDHHYQPHPDAHRRHSAQPPSHPHPYLYDYPYYPHRPHPLNRAGSFDEGYPEYHYPRSHWDTHYGAPPPQHYPPHLPPPPPSASRHSAYVDDPPHPHPPLPPPHVPASSTSSSRPSDDNSNSHRTGQQLSDGGILHPNHDSYAEDGEGEGEGGGGGGRGEQSRRGGNQSLPKFRNLRFKFGTDMPSTIDLKSAIESCDILCRFALHYGNQVKSSGSMSHETVEGSALGLDPIERANLQKIRSMNTTMLIGIQKAEKMNDPSLSSSATAGGDRPLGETLEADRMMMEEEIELDEREVSPLRFGPGQPWNVMVLELARAATSIFQLAIRIKAWVNMTPEERELDEEINMIRGKRCLLMDSTLAVPTVDQHGNLQKDWAVVPASTSTSKSFYQRQRDLEQQRQTHAAVLPKQPKNSQAQSTAAKHELGSSLDSNGMMTDHDGASETNTFKIPRRSSSSGGVSSTAASRLESLKGLSGVVSLIGGGGGNSGSAKDSSMSNSFTSSASSVTSSLTEGTSAYRSADGATRNSKNSDVPHQKYRKRAKRSQAPGRCQSCHSSDTPEWRRGPDGARTLCNACGLHYAKLLRRQNEQAQQSPSRNPIALPSLTPGTTATNSSSSSAAPTSTPSTPLSLPAPTPVATPAPTAPVSTAAPAEVVSGEKTMSRPSSRMSTGFPVISFPFKRLHGQGKPGTLSSSATTTVTATTATSTATVMATINSEGDNNNIKRSGSGSLSLSLSSTSSSGRRTLTDHQVVPLYDGQGSSSKATIVSRGGSATNTSQYQLLQRQQQQYQRMEFQKPHQNQNQNQQSYMQDVSMDESSRGNREN